MAKAPAHIEELRGTDIGADLDDDGSGRGKGPAYQDEFSRRRREKGEQDINAYIRWSAAELSEAPADEHRVANASSRPSGR